MKNGIEKQHKKKRPVPEKQFVLTTMTQSKNLVVRIPTQANTVLCFLVHQD